MDRLNRTVAGCGLMLLMAAGGCRSTRPEVPPGRPYTNDGRQVPPIAFSSEPHAMSGPGITAGMPAGLGQPQLGTPGPASAGNYGAPTANQYGAPGYTAGMAQMPPGLGQSGGGAEATAMPSYGGMAAPSGSGMTNPAAAAGGAPATADPAAPPPGR
jgi:hypothetical protein